MTFQAKATSELVISNEMTTDMIRVWVNALPYGTPVKPKVERLFDRFDNDAGNKVSLVAEWNLALGDETDQAGR